MRHCPACGRSLSDAQGHFCPSCGQPLPAAASTHSENAPADEFLRRLLRRLEAEHDRSFFPKLAEHYYTSGFRELLDQQQGQALFQPGESFWADALDLFIIHYCRELLSHSLPEAILAHQGKSLREIDLDRLIWDYLEPAKEPDRYYRDLAQMPLHILKNASRFFLTPNPRERIFLLCDQSMLAKGQEGFAFTELALYWKAYLHRAQRVAFADLETVKREKTWLTINGRYFDGGPGLNAKMLRLLDKLARLHRRPG